MSEALNEITNERWSGMSQDEREAIRAPAYPEQLAPHLGWRVEVETTYGETRRFIVGRSTG